MHQLQDRQFRRLERHSNVILINPILRRRAFYGEKWGGRPLRRPCGRDFLVCAAQLTRRAIGAGGTPLVAFHLSCPALVAALPGFCVRSEGWHGSQQEDAWKYCCRMECKIDPCRCRVGRHVTTYESQTVTRKLLSLTGGSISVCTSNEGTIGMID